MSKIVNLKLLYVFIFRSVLVAEQFFLLSAFCISGCTNPENLCQAVTDLRLQEQLEENKIITEQLEKLIIEEKVMKKQICDLQVHSETTEHEADTLKATNLELQGKVCCFITTFLVLLWACYKIVNIYFCTKKGRQSIDPVIFNSSFARGSGPHCNFMDNILGVNTPLFVSNMQLYFTHYLFGS